MKTAYIVMICTGSSPEERIVRTLGSFEEKRLANAFLSSEIRRISYNIGIKAAVDATMYEERLHLRSACVKKTACEFCSIEYSIPCDAVIKESETKMAKLYSVIAAHAAQDIYDGDNHPRECVANIPPGAQDGFRLYIEETQHTESVR